MLEEESSQPTAEPDDAPIDVKARLAQMSGTRLLQEQAERKAAAQERTEPKKKKKKRKKPAADVEVEAESQPEPEAAPAEAKPAKAKARSKTAKPAKQKRETASLSAPVSLLVGLFAGCLPGLVFAVAHVVGTESPTNLPAEAVERQGDWIHCPKADGAGRWSCDVYDFAGTVIGHGQFVPSVPKTQSDWRVLAREGTLVPDGSYEARNARAVILYVRGVAVGSAPAPRSK